MREISAYDLAAECTFRTRIHRKIVIILFLLSEPFLKVCRRSEILDQLALRTSSKIPEWVRIYNNGSHVITANFIARNYTHRVYE